MFRIKPYYLAIIMALFCLSLFIGVQSTYAQTSDPNREIEIYEASLSAEHTHPDRPIMFTWDTNADQVSIYYFFGDMSTSNREDACQPCPTTGSVNLHSASAQLVFFDVTINPGTPQARTKSTAFSIKCDPDAWFFGGDQAPSRCPNAAPYQEPLEIQQFEHGVMFRRVNTNPNTVFVMMTNSQFGNSLYALVESSWSDGMPQDNHPDLTPPPQLYKPNGHFGAVWGDAYAFYDMEQNVRDALGWATAPSVTYSGYFQGPVTISYKPPTNVRFFSTPNNSVYRLMNAMGSQQWSTFQNEGGSSPATGQPCPASGAWPAGCDPNLPPSTNTPTPPPSTEGVPCPASGAWPAGCDPNLPPSTNTPPPSTEGVPCPVSGVWPAGCVPNGGGGSTPPPPPSGNDCVIPPSGKWPPCATAGDPPPADTPDDCVIPASGTWPPCARGGR